MTYSLLSIFAFSAFLSSAQVNTELRINHRLGSQTFSSSATAQNNMGQDFKVDRLEYYLTRITVVHDGGQSTAVSDDTIALVQATNGPVTTIELGMLNITMVEDVKFHIGVYSPENTNDPSIWPVSHPLAPKSPSMHWGWASGYRFIAFEGSGGTGFSQNFELHGLGDMNYFETTVSGITGVMDNSTLVIGVDADYERGVEAIDVSTSTISHGFTGEALTAVENFRDYVFSPSQEAIGIEELDNNIAWEVYPNPSNTSDVQVAISSDLSDFSLMVTNTLGQTVSVKKISKASITTLHIENAGIYFVSIVKEGKTLASKKIIRG